MKGQGWGGRERKRSRSYGSVEDEVWGGNEREKDERVGSLLKDDDWGR